VSEVDELLEAASEQAGGLDDFGDDHFREPLARFLESAATETPFVPGGIEGLRQEVVRLLVNRLLTQDGFNRYPEIRDEQVADPIVITGLPRTGTTKLQRMMGADPAKQAVQLWRVLFPAPLPGTEGAQPDPRIALAEQFTAQIAALEPDFMAAHAMVATEPEEEALLAQSTFDRLGVLNWMYDVPGYHRWLQPRDQTDAYRYLADQLRYLQWQDGGRRGRPWVLKAPGHTANIETLLDVFPRATIVHCHRDPVVVLPSFCRLVELIWRTRGHRENPHRVGEFLLDLLPGELARNLEQRARLGSGAPIVDLRFDDIVNDPFRVIGEIHERHGSVLTDASRAAMTGWSDANPAGKHGAHAYSLERYGLTGDGVREAFADYYRHFSGVLACG
jgi:hypothetical protein